MISMQNQTLSEEQHSLITSIADEYTEGMKVLNSLHAYTCTVYGGSRVKETHPSYKKVFEVCQKLAVDGWSVVTGGGPGMMTAALDGVNAGGGQAVSFTINISSEPQYDKTHFVYNLTQFSVRKYLLRQSDIFIVAPGGVGTFDEMFELITLTMTDKYPNKPIFLLDKEFWNPMINWIENTVMKDRDLIAGNFWDIVHLVDTYEEIKQILK